MSEPVESYGPFAMAIDATGLNCPLPLLKLKKALATMQAGGRVYLSATDPNTVRDVSDYVKQARHALIHTTAAAGIFHIVVEKQ